MAEEARVFDVRPSAAADKWQVAEEGVDSPEEFDTREQAIEAAKKLAQAHGPSRLRVHSSDGRVEHETSYEEDPLVRQLAEFGF